MRVGIGLPAAVPETDMTLIGRWAAEAERAGFESVGAIDRAWAQAGREDRPRIMTGRYFSLGPDADERADEYIHHYYGPDFFDPARADTLTKIEQLHAELRRLSEARCTQVLLFPCSGDLEQVSLLAQALRATDERRFLRDADLESESRTDA